MRISKKRNFFGQTLVFVPPGKPGLNILQFFSQFLGRCISYNTCKWFPRNYVHERKEIMPGLYKLFLSTNKVAIRNGMYIGGERLC